MSDNKTQDYTHLITPLLITIILLLIALMQMTTDLYLPSLPAITTAFSSNAETIQMTLSVFMLGFSASHVFYGPISDRIGRRPPILFGVGLSVIGSMICFLAPSANMLILGRFVQGIGIGCCNSVGRSLARDLLTDRMLAQIGSHIGMVSVVILAVSPTLGGYIQEYFGWRVSFLLLLVFGILMWVFAYRYLPETNQHPNPAATKLRVMAHHYKTLFCSRIFMGYTLCSCFAGAGMVAYLTVAPFIFQDQLSLTPVQYGWLAFFIAGAIFISGFINSKLVLVKGVPVMVLTGAYLMLVGGVLMLIFALFGSLTLFSIMFPIVIFSMGAGFVFINAFAGAFDPFPKIAGTVGALYGCLQDLSAALISGMMAVLQVNEQFLLAFVLIILSILSLLAWKFLAHSRSIR